MEDRPRRPRRRADDDGDFPVSLAPARPLVPEGKYEARSSSARRGRFWQRQYLELGFTLFDGAAVNGVILASRINLFVPLVSGDGTKPGPDSVLAHLIRLLGQGDVAAVQAKAFLNKLWLVEVVTVTSNRRGEDLPANAHYSKIGRVLERLA